MSELRVRTIVMAGGAMETPRLWFNSGLPDNPWIGRGLTNHYFDRVKGWSLSTPSPRSSAHRKSISTWARTRVRDLIIQDEEGWSQPGFDPGMFALLLYSFSQLATHTSITSPWGAPGISRAVWSASLSRR